MPNQGQHSAREGNAQMGGIAGAKSIEELYTILRGMQTYNRGLKDRGDYALIGSDGKRWTAEMIITEIEKAKRGEAAQLTRTSGLREKAQLLLAKARVESETSLGNKTAFYRQWTPTIETYARNLKYNSPAHVTFALEIVGKMADFKDVPTEAMILEALKQADQAIKNPPKKG